MVRSSFIVISVTNKVDIKIFMQSLHSANYETRNN